MGYREEVEREIAKEKAYTVEILVNATVSANSLEGSKKRATLVVANRDEVNWTQVQRAWEGTDDGRSVEVVQAGSCESQEETAEGGRAG